MFKFLLIVAVFTFRLQVLHAQTTGTFHRFLETTEEDYAYDVTSIGNNFYFCGITDTTPEAGYDGTIGKLDYNGNLIWSKQYGGIGPDLLYHIKATQDHHLVVLGYTATVSAGGYDAWVMKTDTLGTVLWSKSIGTAAGEDGVAILELASGNLILGLLANRPGASDLDFQLIGLDAGTGSIRWTKTMGTTFNDQLYDLRLINSSEMIAVGTTTEPGIDQDILIIKADTSGNIQWAKQIGSPSSYEKGVLVRVKPFIGTIMIGAEQYSTKNQVLLFDIDANGNIGSTHSYLASETLLLEDVYFSISSGSYLLIAADNLGFSGWNMGMIRLENSYTVDWSNVFGYAGNDMAYSLVRNDASDTWLTAGYGSYRTTYNQDAMFIQVTDSGYASGCNTIPFSLTTGNPSLSSTSPWIAVNSTNPTLSDFSPVRTLTYPLRENVLCSTVALEPNFSSNSVSLFPIPADESLTLSHGDFAERIEWTVMDLNSKILLSGTSLDGLENISLVNIQAGIYQVVVRSESKTLIRLVPVIH